MISSEAVDDPVAAELEALLDNAMDSGDITTGPAKFPQLHAYVVQKAIELGSQAPDTAPIPEIPMSMLIEIQEYLDRDIDTGKNMIGTFIIQIIIIFNITNRLATPTADPYMSKLLLKKVQFLAKGEHTTIITHILESLKTRTGDENTLKTIVTTMPQPEFLSETIRILKSSDATEAVYWHLMNTANFMCMDYQLYSREIDENLRTIIYNVFDYMLKPGEQTNNQKINMDRIQSAYQKRTNVNSLLTLVKKAIESDGNLINITIEKSDPLYKLVTTLAIHLAGKKEDIHHVYGEISSYIKTNRPRTPDNPAGFSKKFEWIIQFAIMFNIMQILHETSKDSSYEKEIRKYKKRVKFMSHAENTEIVKHVNQFAENEKSSRLANIDSNLPKIIRKISSVSDYITAEIESLQKMAEPYTKNANLLKEEKNGSLLPHIDTRVKKLAADILTEDPSETALHDITVNILRYWVAANIMIHSEHTYTTTDNDMYGYPIEKTHTDSGEPYPFYDIGSYITAIKVIIKRPT
jgi:hypothetical protein